MTTSSAVYDHSIDDLLVAAGERLFAEPLSDWSRKLLFTMLVAGALTWLLALGYVTPIKTEVAGTDLEIKPEVVPVLAAVATAYVLVLFVVSCHQDIEAWRLKLRPVSAQLSLRSALVSTGNAEFNAKLESLKREEEQLEARLRGDPDVDLERFNEFRLQSVRALSNLTREQIGTSVSMAVHKLLRDLAAAELSRDSAKMNPDLLRLWQNQREQSDVELRADALVVDVTVMAELVTRSAAYLRIRQITQVIGPATFSAAAVVLAFIMWFVSL